jgi:hypothetical protein
MKIFIYVATRSALPGVTVHIHTKMMGGRSQFRSDCSDTQQTKQLTFQSSISAIVPFSIELRLPAGKDSALDQ